VQQISCYRLNQIKVAMMNLISWCLHQTAAPPPAFTTGVYPAKPSGELEHAGWTFFTLRVPGFKQNICV
jgi:hypothetical protein